MTFPDIFQNTPEYISVDLVESTYSNLNRYFITNSNILEGNLTVEAVYSDQGGELHFESISENGESKTTIGLMQNIQEFFNLFYDISVPTSQTGYTNKEFSVITDDYLYIFSRLRCSKKHLSDAIISDFQKFEKPKKYSSPPIEKDEVLLIYTEHNSDTLTVIWNNDIAGSALSIYCGDSEDELFEFLQKSSHWDNAISYYPYHSFQNILNTINFKHDQINILYTDDSIKSDLSAEII